MLSVALLCIACAAYWWWRQKSVKPTEPPSLPGGWPLMGHAPRLIADSCTLWNRVNVVDQEITELGGVVNASLGSKTVYVLTDPEDSLTVANLCLEKDTYYRAFGKAWLGNGLVTARSLWNRVNVVDQEITELGGVVNASLGSKTVYVLTDPEDSLTVANLCLEKDTYYRAFGKAWLGNGLVTARYAVWKNHRKLLNPAFSQVLLDTFMGIFNSQSRKLVKDLEKEVGRGDFNHWTYTRHNALETICMTALGVDFTDSNLNSKYVQALELVFTTLVERFIKFWWHYSKTFAWSRLKKKQDVCLKILHNTSNTVLQKRKAQIKQNINAEKNAVPGSKFKPFIDLLLELSAEKGVFTDKEIRDHVDTILVAGHDTSANVLMFTMMLLGSHPEVQEKSFAEIKEVLGGNRDVKKTDLSKLVYLEAVLKESMRVFTIVPAIARKLDKDIKLKNCTLSAGETCVLLLFGIHKHPVWGPDVNEFKPERWLAPDCPNAFAAFGLGKRHCIGKVYAMMSMKTTLAHVVRSYRIKADLTKLRVKADVMLKPDSGHRIRIERRT